MRNAHKTILVVSPQSSATAQRRAGRTAVQVASELASWRQANWRQANWRQASWRAGLTVVELLVVMAITGIIASLLLPALAEARESARRMQCTSHLKQLGLSLHQYHELQKGLPPGWQPDARRYSAWSWAVPLLPYIEQAALLQKLPFQSAMNPMAEEGEEPATLLPLLICPSDAAERSFALYAEIDEPPGLTNAAGSNSEPDDDDEEHSDTVLTWLPAANYLGVFGTTDPDAVAPQSGNGAFLEKRSVRFHEFQQGLSQSFLIGERTARKLPATWLGFLYQGEDAPARVSGFAGQGPNRDDADECEFDSRHRGVTNFLFGDGHVAAVSDGIEASVYRGYARRQR